MEVSILPVATERELERLLGVRNVMEPRPMTLAGLRAERSGDIADLDLLALDDGAVIGAGSISWRPAGHETGDAFMKVWVEPDHRCRGTGGRLLAGLTAFGREHGMQRATTWVVEGQDAGVTFAEHHGLEIDGGGQAGYLDLTDAAGATNDVAPIPGLEIVTFAQSPELERALYDLEILTHSEIPFFADQPVPSFEAWRAGVAGDPGFQRELTLLALESGRLAGVVLMFDSGDRTAFIGMTTVHPDVRRRGIARYLKAEMARRARDRGWRRIETFNDGTNDRIRALNESLGYRYDPPYVILRGPLPAG